jgi:hypothetical protein
MVRLSYLVRRARGQGYANPATRSVLCEMASPYADLAYTVRNTCVPRRNPVAPQGTRPRPEERRPKDGRERSAKRARIRPPGRALRSSPNLARSLARRDGVSDARTSRARRRPDSSLDKPGANRPLLPIPRVCNRCGRALRKGLGRCSDCAADDLAKTVPPALRVALFDCAVRRTANSADLSPISKRGVCEAVESRQITGLADSGLLQQPDTCWVEEASNRPRRRLSLLVALIRG